MNNVVQIITEPFKHLYEVGQAEDGHWLLFKDGKDTFCPHRNNFLIPGPLGQPQTLNFPCSTSCPLAELKGEPGGKYSYSTNCGCAGQQFTVSVRKSEPKGLFSVGG
ncbi:MAG TPA: hypothetical protein VEA58_08825 [Anaerovoracaceae bacterium]|nr:hypothetical protein [Anaerovoracaceae bacterium]